MYEYQKCKLKSKFGFVTYSVFFSSILILSSLITVMINPTEKATAQITNDQHPNEQSGQGGQSEDFLLYENPTLGFRIEYPAGSSVHEEINGVIFGIPQEAVIKVVVVNNHNASLSQFTDMAIFALRQTLQDFQLVQSKDTVDNKGHFIIYSFSTGGREFDALSYWTLKDDRGFMIRFATLPTNFSDIQPILIKMVNSFNTLGHGEGGIGGPLSQDGAN